MTLLARRLAPALALAALVLAGCSSATESVRDDTGAVTESNDDASVYDMQEGDCFNEPDIDAEEVETLPAVPCAEEHDYEVFEAYTMDGDEFPGDASVEATADEVCATEFTEFVGLSYQDSALDLNYLFPTADSWSRSDREITCLVLDPERPTAGTLKGANR